VEFVNNKFKSQALPLHLLPIV